MSVAESPFHGMGGGGAKWNPAAPFSHTYLITPVGHWFSVQIKHFFLKLHLQN